MSNCRKAALFFVSAILAAVVLGGCGGAKSVEGAKKIAVDGGSFTDVMPDTLNEMLRGKNFVLVNVHLPYAGELEKTDLFLPYNDPDQLVSKLADKKAQVVLYCQSGYMSAVAAQTLVKLGYTNVWSLHGGMEMWKDYGYPLLRRQAGN
ncbi:MAG: rhodanese-like domain-containing protein [Chloroflexi bacterium]|nr:rhodanese-like domain-containing protein [Chloroflexota bacterium]